jgi:hypothetical protein|tara:strand:+ start:58 stop:291 length:234 start_codon:yes stop_codon:yes gene_type:complete
MKIIKTANVWFDRVKQLLNEWRGSEADLVSQDRRKLIEYRKEGLNPEEAVKKLHEDWAAEGKFLREQLQSGADPYNL